MAKSVKFVRVCDAFGELYLGTTYGAQSGSDVALVSIQSRTYSVRFGTYSNIDIWDEKKKLKL